MKEEEPVFHLRSYGDVSAAELEAYVKRKPKKKTDLEATKEELLHLWEDMKYVQRVAGDFSPTSYDMTSIKEIAMYWRNWAAKQVKRLEALDTSQKV